MMTSASDWFATVPSASRRFSLALEEDGMLPAAALEKALENAAVPGLRLCSRHSVFLAEMAGNGGFLEW